LLLHYERFVFLPPPFNIPHFTSHLMLYTIPSLKKKYITDSRWRLVGKWQHDETWKVQQKLELFNERLYWPYGGIDKYSTTAWREKVSNDISKLVEENIDKAHQDVVKNILIMWEKGIKKKSKQKDGKVKSGGFINANTLDILHSAWLNKSIPGTKKLIKYRLARLEYYFLQFRKEAKERENNSKKAMNDPKNILSPRQRQNMQYKTQKNHLQKITPKTKSRPGGR